MGMVGISSDQYIIINRAFSDSINRIIREILECKAFPQYSDTREFWERQLRLVLDVREYIHNNVCETVGRGVIK